MSPRLRRIVVLERANSDLEWALDHYLDTAPEFADGFLHAVEKAFAHIRRSPATGSPRYAHELGIPGLRSWPCSRYPYLIFYMERENHIEVWRVLHGKSDIPGWMDTDA